MKIQIKLLLGLGLLCAGSILWFALTPSAPQADTVTKPGASRTGKPGIVEFAADTAAPAAARDATANSVGEESAPVDRWHARFAELLHECGNREEASACLIAELDEAYHGWVSSKIEALAKLPPIDRYDTLAEMEARIRKVAEAILGHLGIAGGRHYEVLAGTLEAIAAEVQYAEMAGTHDQRVAMLRLDRERASRFGKLLAANGLGADTETQVSREIEPWYASQLRGILGVADETK